MSVEYIEPTRPENVGKWEDGERKKMKPCPFCGCKKLSTFRVWYTDTSCHGVVECASCKCDFFIADIATGKREEITDNEKELIRRIIVDRWNIRA